MDSDISYDVVVIGYGGAGAAAAMEAHDAGARVAVLERAVAGGGNTRTAGGSIRVVADATAMIKHMVALSRGATDRDSILSHVDGLADLPTWIENNGGSIEVEQVVADGQYIRNGVIFPRDSIGSPYSNVEGGEGFGPKYRWRGRDGFSRGEAAFDFLEHNVRSRGIDIYVGCRVLSLHRGGDGRVTGLVASIGGEHVRVNASQGVVLACGGFEWDAMLQVDNLGAALPACGPPGRNTGDGIRMAQSIGATMWHMGAAVLQFGVVVPDYPASFPLAVAEIGFIVVDGSGRRFCDESSLDSHEGGLLLLGRERSAAGSCRTPSYLIFDESTRQAGPIVSVARGYNRGAGWTRDNSSAIDNGWVKSGRTLGELANKLDIPFDELNRTLNAYNKGIENGLDPYGRPSSNGRPLLGGPFYGIGIWPCIINTQGGPRRTSTGQVVDAWLDPIPGLYSAGELGSIWTDLYPGGGNFGEALISGRAAGRSASHAPEAD